MDRKNTGRLYIGGVNRIYELQANLEKKSQLNLFAQDSSSISTKALAIDDSLSRLIICNTANGGRCQVRIKMLKQNTIIYSFVTYTTYHGHLVHARNHRHH